MLCEIQSPYLTKATIDSLNYTKVANSNSILIFSTDIKPHILTIENDGYKWILSPLTFNDGPYREINTTDITLTPEKYYGNDVKVIASDGVFNFSDAGRHLRIYDKKTKIWGWGIITSVINNRCIKVDIKKPFRSVNSSKYWRKGVFNNYDSFPRLGKIFNSRLYLANTIDEKSKVWSSCYNDYLNFAPTNSSDESNMSNIDDIPNYETSITFDLSNVKSILWLDVNFQYLVIGTLEGIFTLVPLDLTKILSPYNFTVKKLTNNATTKLVVSSDKHIFFVTHKNKLSVLEFVNNFLTANIIDDLLSSNMNSRLVVTDIAISSSSENIVTVLLNDEYIAFITVNNFDKEYVYAFSEGILGGNKSKVKAISSNNNILYMLVERIIDSKKVLTLEYINWNDLSLALEEQIELEDLQYLDCRRYYCYNSAVNNIIVNRNDTIAILADHSYLGEFNLKDGKINLKLPAFNIIQGYNYNSYYESIDLSHIPLVDGLLTYSKLNSLAIGYINSLGGILKLNNKIINNNLACLDLIQVHDKLFTGYKRYNTNFSYQNSLNISITQNNPLPLNINYLGVEIIYS